MKRNLSVALIFLICVLSAFPVFAAEKYTLTIHYQFEDGTTALDSFTDSFEQGQSFQVFTPLIEGYAPTLHNIRGEMGNTDLTYTVVFKVIAKPEIPSSSENTSSETPAPPVEESSKPTPPQVSTSAPRIQDSVFSSWGDDFLDKEDFVAFDEATLKDAEGMMKSSIGSITSIALYGLLLIIAVFAVFEIIRAIAF